jgi:thioredoxin-related protein
MRTTLITFILTIFSLALFSQEKNQPYDEKANPRNDIKAAVDKAKKENKHVLIQFGGNWCPWCIRFHAMVQKDHIMDSLMKADYIWVLANVPREKEKRDYNLFKEYNYPNRFGYPVFVILDGNGKELHIQDSGILEHCTEKGYDTTKVVTFLRQWNVKALDPATYKVK